ncbi:hypothetical protein [Methylobrevis albus]|uniref:Uncharacterized protein n=1 Tax=Methylobrevis albus TaxID=2793297 RepID=A0A931I1V3_9HYPH|nr:hypothetical protein [Methylobrevis albus]MBH0237889.1 hypothetical protein [Methylobrevis albus]
MSLAHEPLATLDLRPEHASDVGTEPAFLRSISHEPTADGPVAAVQSSSEEAAMVEFVRTAVVPRAYSLAAAIALRAALVAALWAALVVVFTLLSLSAYAALRHPMLLTMHDQAATVATVIAAIAAVASVFSLRLDSE